MTTRNLIVRCRLLQVQYCTWPQLMATTALVEAASHVLSPSMLDRFQNSTQVPTSVSCSARRSLSLGQGTASRYTFARTYSTVCPLRAGPPGSEGPQRQYRSIPVTTRAAAQPRCPLVPPTTFEAHLCSGSPPFLSHSIFLLGNKHSFDSLAKYINRRLLLSRPHRHHSSTILT